MKATSLLFAATWAAGLALAINQPCFAQGGVASDDLQNAPPTQEKEAEPDSEGLDDSNAFGLGEALGDDDEDGWPGATLFVAPAWVSPSLSPWDEVLTSGSGIEGGISFTQGDGIERVGYVPSSWGGIKYSRHRFGFQGGEERANVSGWSLFSGDATDPLFVGRPVTLSFFSGGEAGIYRMTFPDGTPEGLSSEDLNQLLPQDKWKLGGAFRLGARLNLPGNTSLSYTAGIHGIQQDMRWGHWLGSRAILGVGRIGLAIPFIVAGKSDSLLHSALGAAMNLGWFWLNYTQKYNWPWDDPAPRWYVAQLVTFSVNLPQNQPITERSEGFE